VLSTGAGKKDLFWRSFKEIKSTSHCLSFREEPRKTADYSCLASSMKNLPVIIQIIFKGHAFR